MSFNTSFNVLRTTLCRAKLAHRLRRRNFEKPNACEYCVLQEVRRTCASKCHSSTLPKFSEFPKMFVTTSCVVFVSYNSSLLFSSLADTT